MNVNLHRDILTIVIEEIHPARTVEISPSELPQWITEYGNIRSQEGIPAKLLGVRLPQHSHVVSYAGCYYRVNADLTWKTWHLYIGASGGSGLTVDRGEA